MNSAAETLATLVVAHALTGSIVRANEVSQSTPRVWRSGALANVYGYECFFDDIDELVTPTAGSTQ